MTLTPLDSGSRQGDYTCFATVGALADSAALRVLTEAILNVSSLMRRGLRLDAPSSVSLRVTPPRISVSNNTGSRKTPEKEKVRVCTLFTRIWTADLLSLQRFEGPLGNPNDTKCQLCPSFRPFPVLAVKATSRSLFLARVRRARLSYSSLMPRM